MWAASEARRLAGLDFRAVVRAGGQEMQRRQKRDGIDDREDREIHQSGFGHGLTPSRELEADVLQSVCGLAVEPGRKPVVTAARGEVPEGDPRPGAMATRGELVVGLLAGAERLLRLVEAVLFEQRAAEDELGVADLVDVVDAVTEQLERVAGLLLCTGDVAGAEVDLGDAVHGVRGLCVVPDLEGDADRVLQERDRLVGMAEQEVDPPEVVEQPAEVASLGDLLVQGLRALRVVARDAPSGPRGRR